MQVTASQDSYIALNGANVYSVLSSHSQRLHPTFALRAEGRSLHLSKKSGYLLGSTKNSPWQVETML
jgi:hypothetical protein